MEGSKSELREPEQVDEGTEKANPSGDLITFLEPSSAVSETYRTLRTGLLYSSVDNPPKVIVVTSPGSEEGKSTTCANLAVTLAQAGKSTLVLDCDFRRPSVHRIFGIRNFSGVVNVLVGDNALHEVWHEPLPSLKVVPVGTLPHNPAELLSSVRFAEFLKETTRGFDYVLLDAPPTGHVSDPAILASQADGVLLVLDARKTRKVSLRKAKRSLEAVGANILGTVMNKAKGRVNRYEYTY